MKKVNSIVIGLGEVGSSLKAVISEHYETAGVDFNSAHPGSCEYLNICIPYDNDFVNTVNAYVEEFKPALTIVHSTVPVGTTKKIKGQAVHSPVRGKHPNIQDGLRCYVKFIGYNTQDAKILAENYAGKVFDCCYIENTDFTEFMKIQSLAKYCAYLGIADEIAGLCNAIGMDYDLTKLWDKTQNEQVHKFYQDMELPLLDPPNNKIGGHCVLPVTKILVEDDRFNTEIISKIYKKYADL